MADVEEDRRKYFPIFECKPRKCHAYRGLLSFAVCVNYGMVGALAIFYGLYWFAAVYFVLLVCSIIGLRLMRLPIRYEIWPDEVRVISYGIENEIPLAKLFTRNYTIKFADVANISLASYCNSTFILAIPPSTFTAMSGDLISITTYKSCAEVYDVVLSPEAADKFYNELHAAAMSNPDSGIYRRHEDEERRIRNDWAIYDARVSDMKAEQLSEKKRCQKCTAYSNEADNKPGSCCHHDGHYAMMSGWSCCGRFNDTGCKRGFHVWASTKTLEKADELTLAESMAIEAEKNRLLAKREQQMREDAERRARLAEFQKKIADMHSSVGDLTTVATIVEDEDEDIELEEDDKGGKEPAEREPYKRHKVMNTDTLAGLALFYGTTVENLKKINGMMSFKDDSVALLHKSEIFVPWPKENKPINPENAKAAMERERKRKIREFIRKAQSISAVPSPTQASSVGVSVTQLLTDHSVTQEEAVFYLSNSGWNVEKALNTLKDDQTWEQERKKDGRNQGLASKAGVEVVVEKQIAPEIDVVVVEETVLDTSMHIVEVTPDGLTSNSMPESAMNDV